MPTYDEKTGLSLDDARSKLAGLHFAQESLTKSEREILYIAEAVLRMYDAATQEIERLTREREAMSPLHSLLDDWRWADMDQYDIQDNDLARRIVEALAATERELAAIRHAAGLGEG